jgi:hypothetical protein
MSFPFNTAPWTRQTIDRMKTTTPPSCPCHAGAPPRPVVDITPRPETPLTLRLAARAR